MMKLLLDGQRQQLIANGSKNAERHNKGHEELDFFPVVKLFAPDAAAIWLLTEIMPDDEDMAFGLCDLGVGSPELGYVSLSELATVRGRLGLPVERDRHFTATQTLSTYAGEARQAGCILA